MVLFLEGQVLFLASVCERTIHKSPREEEGDRGTEGGMGWDGMDVYIRVGFGGHLLYGEQQGASRALGSPRHHAALPG